MNVYHVGKCPRCGEPVVFDGETAQCPICRAEVAMGTVATVMVHGAAAVHDALRMLTIGHPLSYVAARYCACCGGEYAEGHGCYDPRPQYVGA